MDPFTQRMLERARARREKIDSKLADNGQEVTPRKPLVENKIPHSTSVKSPPSVKAAVKSPERRKDVLSPQRSKKSGEPPARRPSKDSESPRRPSCLKSPARRVSTDERTDPVCRSPARRASRDDKTKNYVVGSPRQSDLREVCVTTTEYVGSSEERTSDVSVEINIVHRDDVQIQVQVEERDAPITVRRLPGGNTGEGSDKENPAAARDGRAGLRHNAKARLDRLGVLYSDSTELSSPIHRTELEFTSATPPQATPQAAAVERSAGGKRKMARLAALADTINNWEDDTSRHDYKPEALKKAESRAGAGKAERHERTADESTLEVSIHSLRDIERAVRSTKVSEKSPSKAFGRLTGNTVAALVST